MSSARDYLDAGMDALGLLGNPADLPAAREHFRRAVNMDPGMCDAWLGLIATGDRSSETLRHAHEASITVHRETRRLGLHDTAIEAAVPSPGFIEVFPYSPASIALAYVAALLSEGDFDTAEKLLESYDTTAEPHQATMWRCLAVTLHYVTQRWTDALAWAARPVAGTSPVVDSATELMAGIAHVGLGHYPEALALLAGIPPTRSATTPRPTPLSFVDWRYGGWTVKPMHARNWPRPASVGSYCPKPAPRWRIRLTQRWSPPPRRSPPAPAAGIRSPAQYRRSAPRPASRSRPNRSRRS